MIFRSMYYVLVFVCAVFWGATAKAQDTPSLFPSDPSATPQEDQQAEPQAGSEEPDPVSVPTRAPVATAPPTNPEWEEVAAQAEETLAGPTPSLLRLNRLREDLVAWRDQFLDGGQINAGRIATVTGQIDALGTVPEGEEEPEAVAARRAELTAQLDELRAPAILAEESYARADGMIAEIDSLIRSRDTARLGERVQSPLALALWPDALIGLGAGLSRLAVETTAALRADIESGALVRNAPMGLLFLTIAVVLLLRGRQWVLILQGMIDTGTARGRAVWSFLLSLWQVILPVLGLLAFVTALNRFDVLGAAGAQVLDAVFVGGITVIFARWLTAEFFPLLSETSGPLRQSVDTRRRARRVAVALAWGMAIATVIDTLMQIGAQDAPVLSNVILFPLGIILSLLLFRFGGLLRRDPMASSETANTMAGDTENEVAIEDQAPKGRSRAFVGRICQFVGIATPILAAFGFNTAAEALFGPAVVTLAVLGVVILLQRFVNDLWDMRKGAENETAGALAPVLISFVLLMLAMPVLAIVWGARIEDLVEVWSRFREGFAIGTTRISPTDFLTFVAVFVTGYLLTRFIKGTLRSSVMPRTKLDLGGQNAVVAGFGYVGIGLSAIVAITTAGIDLSNLAIVAGALSVGIGFGLQNIVSNFVSGIILLIERPIGEGDWIEVNGTMGYVRDISVRSTRIETFDRTDVIIPNADLVSGQVINYTRGNAVGRVIVPVGVAYGTDTALVTEILTEIATANPMVLLNPPPAVLFIAFGDSSLNFEIRAILRDVNFKMAVLSEMNYQIETRFAEAGIEIPFPQRDLWIKNTDALKGSNDA